MTTTTQNQPAKFTDLTLEHQIDIVRDVRGKDRGTNLYSLLLVLMYISKESYHPIVQDMIQSDLITFCLKADTYLQHEEYGKGLLPTYFKNYKFSVIDALAYFHRDLVYYCHCSQSITDFENFFVGVEDGVIPFTVFSILRAQNSGETDTLLPNDALLPNGSDFRNYGTHRNIDVNQEIILQCYNYLSNLDQQ